MDAVPIAAGGKAFLASELPAVMDLFSDFAGDVDDDGKQVLGLDGMKNLLDSVGERPSEDDLAALFEAADADGNGTVDLDEFLHAADAFLGTHPARCCLVARRDSAEDFSRLNALLFTATGWIFIPANCFAIS